MLSLSSFARSRVAVLTAVLCVSTSAARAQVPAPQHGPPVVAGAPVCPTVSARLDATIDTKIVEAGDLFRFTTLGPAADGTQTIPPGTTGVGVVATLDHSKSHGQSGYLVLEARYLELPNGTHVAAAFVPAGDGNSQAYVRAGSSDAGIIGYLPYYIGTAAGVYDYFHHGKDAAVVAGTGLPLVIGDGYFTGACRLEIDQR